MVDVTLITQDDKEVAGLPSSIEMQQTPRAGESLHYWQDGLPHAAGAYSGIRRDFTVVRVIHDLRHMMAGRERIIHSVVLIVREQPQGTES